MSSTPSLQRRWSPEENDLADRYAQAVIAGRLPNIRQAARELIEERIHLRERMPDAPWLQEERTFWSVALKLQKRAVKLGKPVTWNPLRPEEIEVLDRYARHLVRGRYASVNQAAGVCRAELERRRKRTPAGKDAPPSRSFIAVAAQLHIRARALGRKTDQWTPEEMRVVARFADELAAGRYPSVKEAATDLYRALRKSPAADGAKRRTRVAVQSALRIYTRQHGRRFSQHFRWSEPELKVLRSYARALVQGRFRVLADAVAACQRELKRLRRRYPNARWLAAGRTGSSIHNKLWEIAHRMGRIRRHFSYGRIEARLSDGYARRVARGELTAMDAARDYVRRVEELRRKYPKLAWPKVARTVKAVQGRMLKRARAFGRAPVAERWSGPEMATVGEYARALLAGRYSNAFQAGVECLADIERLHRRHPDKYWARMRRSKTATSHKLIQVVNALTETWTGARWRRAELAVVDDYARGLRERRYEDIVEAARACYADLKRRHERRLRRRPEAPRGPVPRKLEAVTGKLAARAHILGYREKVRHWTPEEIALARKWAERHAAHRGQWHFYSKDRAAQGLKDDLAAAGSQRSLITCKDRISRIQRAECGPSVALDATEGNAT